MIDAQTESARLRRFLVVLAELCAEGVGTNEPFDSFESIRVFMRMNPQCALNERIGFESFARARLLRLRRLRRCSARPRFVYALKSPRLSEMTTTALAHITRADRDDLTRWLDGRPQCDNSGRPYDDSEAALNNILSALGRFAIALRPEIGDEVLTAKAIWYLRLTPEEYAASRDIAPDTVDASLQLITASLATSLTPKDFALYDRV